ncbi:MULTISPECIES: hypothetical protein [unclassified Rhizobium]|uniref:hypothetical protein n=1 Tax=unclassified Rhizobium TaxID=2613769 RepID=UPI001B319FEC|nr:MULTISPECIES: hypothetical protein [unclassified Rhizobium]MBX5256876.1 hypothetical protein [Rhizobium sp. NLR16b]MBX5262968.1 hypothetical protein [Rhizobium sp. NLR16a]MBX5311533.1 hypothetical protein [Rhizobium sp. NLR11b]QTU95931.1 hypothetical protein J7U39_16000 [Rhizobium sp. NLR16a]
MTNSTIKLVAHLKERIAKMSVPVPSESFLASPLFQMVLRGDAKLPLHCVEEVASVIGADVRQLFRLAARQFYDEDAIRLFERMLGTPMTNEEQKWLHEIRSGADGPVDELSSTARCIVRALAKPQASA